MMRYYRLDRYILLKYIKTFLLALALIIVIIITFDVSEKLDNFLSHHATFWMVVTDYYFNFIPGIVNLYSPLFIFEVK
ncbi:MAG: LptF/LptG family permease [Bacteroidales bacterium]|nr:LptF/LptG family permease [Bacteroidales bacterium]